MLDRQVILGFVDGLESEAESAVSISSNGAKGIGVYEDGTMLPYSSILFPPMNPSYRRVIEARHKRSLPEDYYNFLCLHNGGHLFRKKVTLLGYPSCVDEFGQPIDLVYDDLYSRPQGVPSEWFAIGGYPMEIDRNSTLMMEKNGAVHVLVEDELVESWPDFVLALLGLKCRFEGGGNIGD